MANGKRFLFLCVALVLLPGATGATQETVTRPENPGNLESTFDIGCVGADQVENQYTPTDLLRAAAKCASAGRYDEGGFLYLLATVYGQFDVLRVADTTAREAVLVAPAQAFADLDPSSYRALIESIFKLVPGPEALEATREAIARIGPPAYYPRYMIQHGLATSTPSTPSSAPAGNTGAAAGLVADFDAAAAWRQVLDGVLEGLASAAAAEKAVAEEWAWLQRTETDMNGKREQLKMAQGTPRAEALQAEVNRLSDAFNRRLVDFLNGQLPQIRGELTSRQREAFDMKAAEDLLLAQEHIDKGGDHATAIEIYTAALALDPGNRSLLAAKARAESLQYMSPERFTKVTAGMTPSQVRELLGTPNPGNVGKVEDGVVAWFYPKKEPQTGAGVFFHEEGGELIVFATDFAAVKATSE